MTLHITPLIFLVIMAVVKILVIFGAAMTSVPLCVYWERKLCAWIQHRDGPTKVGPFGILQTFVDGAKLFLKEEITPDMVVSPLHRMAPALTVIPAIFALAIIPFSSVIEFTPRAFSFFGLASFTFDPVVYRLPIGITDLDIGILAYMAITGVGVYGIVLAGWASNSKYALLGGIRSTAQMLSYEIAMGLSIVGVLLIAGTFNLRDIIGLQNGGFWTWNVVTQPVGFLLFMTAGFAETNRAPFDLTEADAELVGGYNTEFGGGRFASYYFAEYLNVLVVSGIVTTVFLGGWLLPFGIHPPGWVNPLVVLFKMGLVTFLFIWARATLPRLRYDQLMSFGWKVLLPLATLNTLVTAILVVATH